MDRAGKMKKIIFCLILYLFVTRLSMADYIMISGSNDTNNSTQSIIRYRDDFIVIWERSAATGTPEPYVNDIEVSPLDPAYNGGDIYTVHYGFDPPTGLSARCYDTDTGEFIGQVVPSAAGDGQYDGTGTYLPQIEGRSAVLQDITFGYDYNGDGVQDLWAARRDWFEIYDGTTLNRTGPDGTADILTWLDIPDSVEGMRDGTGAFGICFGLDVTGDGIGELYAMRGINSPTGSRLNVWNPVTLTQVATYNMDGVRDNSFIILGPDVNGDGLQDLWVAEARNHRLVAIDCATGQIISNYISLVDAGDPGGEFTLRYPQHISYGPDDSILISTRFASSLDEDWVGAGDIQGGDLLQIVWNPETQQGLVTLLYEHSGRLSGTVYIPVDKSKSQNPFPINRAEEVARDGSLSWTPGIYADKHNVYLGNDFNDVNEASVADPRSVLVSQNLDGAKFIPPNLLEYGMTYYWRIDDVNEANPNKPRKGDVWSFTVRNYTVVEDFESYNDLDTDQAGSRRIYLIWIDGFDNPSVNGSTMGYPEPSFVDGEHFVETNIVHGGLQSAPIYYDHTIAGYSEVTVSTDDLSVGRDWAADAYERLSLWIYGEQSNSTTEQMYLKLNDTKVTYEGDLTEAQWREWSIDLAVFNQELGNVRSLSIGFDKTGVIGGSGTVFIDDIRLYKPVEPVN
jgi:hypothetical protein